MILGALVLLFLFFVLLHAPGSILLRRLDVNIYELRYGQRSYLQILGAISVTCFLASVQIILGAPLLVTIFLQSPLRDTLWDPELNFRDTCVSVVAALPPLLTILNCGLIVSAASRPSRPFAYDLTLARFLLSLAWVCHVCFTLDRVIDVILEYNDSRLSLDAVNEFPLVLVKPLSVVLCFLEFASLTWHLFAFRPTTLGQVFGVSSGESTRVQARSRASDAAQARASRQSTGPTPPPQNRPILPTPSHTLLGPQTPLRDVGRKVQATASAPSSAEPNPPTRATQPEQRKDATPTSTPSRQRSESQERRDQGYVYPKPKGPLARKLEEQKKRTNTDILREMAWERRRQREIDGTADHQAYN